MTKALDGRSMVDTAELIRVFGEPSLKSQKDEIKQSDERQFSSLTEIAVLKERVESLERDRERLERHVHEAIEREAWLRQQLDKQTALLTTTAETARGGFLSRLLSRKG
jgi:predicted  nucleic acid-binding Zn-ribbon protein